MIARRCSERHFFMRPCRETNNAFICCLALAARKASISIVCVGTRSNHYHAVVVHNHGRLPQFLEHVHKLYGKHQSALRAGDGGRRSGPASKPPWSSWSNPRTCS